MEPGVNTASTLASVAFYALLIVVIGLIALGFRSSRRWPVVVATFVAIPVCFLLCLTYRAGPGLTLLIVVVLTALNLGAALMLHRRRPRAASLLLIPCATMVPLALIGVPLVGRIDPAFTGTVSLGDLDGDGDLDAIVARGEHWPLVNLILRNDGTGHFERQILDPTADPSYSAVLADVQGDGYLDIVVGNDSVAKGIYINDGLGRFTRAGSWGEPGWPTHNVTVLDLNGDRRPDIVAANRGTANNGVGVCLNDGYGNFTSCRIVAVDPITTVASADLSGDGFPDLVVPHRGDGRSYILVNDGRGGFDDNRPFGPATLRSRGVALGDLDGDGWLDIVTGDEERGGVAVYVNRRNASFEDAIAIAPEHNFVGAIAIADMDADGDSDIVIGGYTTEAILVNDGTGRTFALVDLRGDEDRPEVNEVNGVAVGDVDGNGSLDVVTARSGATSMVYLNPLSAKGQRSGTSNSRRYPLFRTDR